LHDFRIICGVFLTPTMGKKDKSKKKAKPALNKRERRALIAKAPGWRALATSDKKNETPNAC
jgi:hypothetical protein